MPNLELTAKIYDKSNVVKIMCSVGMFKPVLEFNKIQSFYPLFINLHVRQLFTYNF